jgi:hypothetical protein
MMLASEGVMTEQAFATVWGLSYSDFEFLNRFGVKSRVAIACHLLFFRQHARFPADRGDLDPDVIAYVADQIGATDDLSSSFSSDTARRQRAGILDFLGFCRASDRDRTKIQAWMIEQLGGRDMNLADWIERGFGQARRMWAMRSQASALAMFFSQSLAIRRQRPSHAKVLSTTHPPPLVVCLQATRGGGG